MLEVEHDMQRPATRVKVVNTVFTKGKEVTAWSQSGNLVTFSPNNAVTMQKQFGEPGNYTVQFGLGSPPGPAGSVAAVRRPKAVVQWSIEGNTVTRELTVLNGTSISGQASAVSVRLFDDLVTGMVGTAGGQYVGSIQVSKGLRAGIQSPVFTPRAYQTVPGGVFVTTNGSIGVAAGVSVNVPIPEGAISVQVTASCDFSPPPVLTQADVQAVFVNEVGAPVSLWFPVPPDIVAVPSQATFLQLRHFAAPAILVDFGVVFGIDG